MFGGLVLALSSAGFLLLVFGERLGLSAEIAAAGVITIFGLMTAGLALVATTSRLALFLQGGSAFGKITVQSGLLLLAMLVIEPANSTKLAHVVLFATFALVMLVLPAPAQQNEEFGPAKEFTFVAAGCTAVMAGILLLHIWPACVALLAACAGLSASAATKFALAIMALPLILGGMSGLSLLIRNLFLIAIVAVLAPSIIEVGRVSVAQLDMTANPLLQLKAWLEAVSVPAPLWRLPVEHPRMVLIGLALALVARTSIKPPIGALTRHFRLFIGVLLAGTTALLVHTVLPSGLANPAVMATTLAAQYGWPIVLGFIWMMLAPMLALGATGLLIHAVACACSDMLAYRVLHPRALKAWRLVMARLFCLALLGALAWQIQTGWRLDPDFALFASSGSAFVLLCALTMQLLRALRRMLRRSDEKPATPADMLIVAP